ncbi:c-type cytochrome domain-containing protein [Verrucomicrobium spinosum]|uniref:c-type cytochrome domain-containing protein n=1 Tax=Verrucomicrobium spinosum TaxID=2736 RepID=UPI001C44E57F|nr:c-type cytochrome domain-containing protein [Verrucomicrobium spinosum]
MSALFRAGGGISQIPLGLIVLGWGSTAWGLQAAEISFEKEVRPILKAHCTHCHGEEDKPEGGVDLRLRRFMDAPLESGGTLLVPGHGDRSELVQIIRRGEMPKKGKKMSDAELAVLEQWIAQGARTSRPEPQHLPPGAVISEEDRAYWAFQPVHRPAVPIGEQPMGHTPVDASWASGSKQRGWTLPRRQTALP